jgi:CRISPR-associated protein Cmr3
MRYLVTLTPLEPFFFGGDKTFGTLGDKENGTYLVKSRYFPQQTALLGMIRKEMLIQKGYLSTKLKGEWVDSRLKDEAKAFIGDSKFEFDTKQEFGVLKTLSAIFLLKDNQKIIKKVDIDSCEFVLDKGRYPLLKNYNPKNDIYDNFISIDNEKCFKTEDIFRAVEQVGNSKFDSQSSLFKRTSYLLEDNFKFAFYIESEFELKDAFVTLGAEKSTFKMEITPSSEYLEYEDKNGYLTLLSDSYITLPIKEHCDFAITSEISFNHLQNEFRDNKKVFKKSNRVRFLYEKGSVFINPKQELIDNLNNQNLQTIGLNQHSYQKGEI